MTNMAIKNIIETTRTHFQVPVTPRGRALHTVDWFMNGKPVISNHDNGKISLEQVSV